MNGGKTHTYFSWASISAWVPPIYTNSTPAPQFSYTHQTTAPRALAPHDSFYAWENSQSGISKAWVRPDYVVKVDDDSFVMLAELEARLRLELHAKKTTPQYASTTIGTELQTTSQTGTSALTDAPLGPNPPAPPPAELDPLIYWGYRVRNRLHVFMAGELYALSWSLVDWVAKDPATKAFTRGAEDKQTAKWMKIHPRASEVRWASERCWIYDHPRSGTVFVLLFFPLMRRTEVLCLCLAIHMVFCTLQK